MNNLHKSKSFEVDEKITYKSKINQNVVEKEDLC
jgi:hypothetical protein